MVAPFWSHVYGLYSALNGNTGRAMTCAEPYAQWLGCLQYHNGLALLPGNLAYGKCACVHLCMVVYLYLNLLITSWYTREVALLISEPTLYSVCEVSPRLITLTGRLLNELQWFDKTKIHMHTTHTTKYRDCKLIHTQDVNGWKNGILTYTVKVNSQVELAYQPHTVLTTYQPYDWLYWPYQPCQNFYIPLF